jgi:hypothetical protein
MQLMRNEERKLPQVTNPPTELARGARPGVRGEGCKAEDGTRRTDFFLDRNTFVRCDQSLKINLVLQGLTPRVRLV